MTTDDRAVPVWAQAPAGNTNDGATVIATMDARREPAQCRDFVLIGARTRLSDGHRRALRAAGGGSLAPLARTPEVDAACLAIAPADRVPRADRSAHERRTPPAERASDRGCERTVSRTLPDGQGRPQVHRRRRLVVVSSDARAAGRRHRGRPRARAAVEIARVVKPVGRRWDPTAARAPAQIETLLARRHRSGR